MNETQIFEETHMFVEQIKQTESYVEYYKALQEVKKEPGLYDRILEFRLKNYELQNNVPEDRMMEESERFENQYEEFCENPLVDRFLAAELAFCRMFQEITEIIEDGIQFE